jgi:hypothetical protein
MHRKNPLFVEALRGAAKDSAVGRAAVAFARVETNSTLLREHVQRGDAGELISGAYLLLCEALTDAISCVAAAQTEIGRGLGEGYAVRLTALLRELAAFVHPLTFGPDGLGFTRGATIPRTYWAALRKLGRAKFRLLGALDLNSPAPLRAADTLDGQAIPLRVSRAWAQYRVAGDALGVPEPVDREAYEQIADAYGTARKRDELPDFGTWRRYLSEYRRLAGQSKHRPRAGRADGARSVAKRSEL